MKILLTFKYFIEGFKERQVVSLQSSIVIMVVNLKIKPLKKSMLKMGSLKTSVYRDHLNKIEW